MKPSNALEVASDQLQQELVEIKERLGAIESVDGLVHQETIATYFENVVDGKEDRKAILRLCKVPQTRDQLATALNKQSGPALDFHLKPLREDPTILHTAKNDAGVLTFEWSYVIKRLPPARRRRILGE